MPLKIRCRCGQELVIRYSEWIYFGVGFLVLSLVVNVTALVLIYVQLRSLEPRPRLQPAAAAPTVAVDTTTPPAPRVTGSDVEAEGVREAAESRPESAVVEAAPSPAPPETVGDAPARSEPARGEAGLPDADTAVEAAVASSSPAVPDVRVDAAADAAGATVPRDEDAPGNAATAEETTAEARKVRFPLDDAFPPFLRLVLAETVAGTPLPAGVDESDPPRILGVLALDPVADVRGRAAARLGEWASAIGDRMAPELAEELAGLARAASARFPGDPHLAELDSSLRSGRVAPDDDLPDERALESARERLETVVASDPGLSALRRDLLAMRASGVDVLLAIDATESMAESFDTLRAGSRWLLPAITRALPESRVAVLFYRDAVAATEDFSSSEDAIVEALRSRTSAEGGRDVAEGVFEALKGALQLGRFSWRPDAVKVIVFVGDAPPPYERKDLLLGLARQAHREGGFDIHAVSTSEWEGWEGVPYFADLARGGGGRAVTALPAALADELFLILFPPESRELARTGLAALKALVARRPGD